MKKIEMFEALGGNVAKSTISVGNEYDGEYTRSIGKYCVIGAPIEDTNDFDFFICNNKNMHDGIGQRKVNNILEMIIDKIGVSEKDITRYDREAAVSVNKSLMPKVDRELLKKLGIRLFPILSDTAKLERINRAKLLQKSNAHD